MLQVVFYVICAAAWVVYLRYYLWMFQQNSNRPERFWKWYRENPMPRLFSRSKVKFVFTPRMQRLALTSTLLAGALGFAISLLPALAAIFALTALVVLLCPFVLLLANLVNSPVEKAITDWYIRDARRILASRPDLKIIGVTGSYGKTSTKNYLYRILSEKYNVLITPGNFNTTLGVVRTIREKLEPFHEVFIVEMGAKQVGDIAEICDLVHPTAGIVTAVGEMHLETFGSLSNIQKTKFELVDSLPADGLAVINEESEGIASFGGVRTDCEVVRYGIDAHRVDVRAANIKYAADGMSFDLIDAQGSIHLQTRLLGEANILDLSAAIILAKRLGVSDRQISIAVGKIQPVEHRLSISRHGSLTILDDAYNSNPAGAAMALGVLASMRIPEGGRRICVTPGFVELGERQAAACRELGSRAVRAADFLIIVNKYNREAILSGAREALASPASSAGDVPTALDSPASSAFSAADVPTALASPASSAGDVPAAQRPGPKARTVEDCVLCVDTLSEAVAALGSLATPGSVILYENDLPDTFV